MEYEIMTREALEIRIREMARNAYYGGDDIGGCPIHLSSDAQKIWMDEFSRCVCESEKKMSTLAQDPKLKSCAEEVRIQPQIIRRVRKYYAIESK